MSRTRSFALISLGIASALGIAWLIRRRREEISGLHAWTQVLIRRHGTEKAYLLAKAVRYKYAALATENPMPENQALRWHMKNNILPGLALYQVLLLEYNGDQQAALAEVDEAIRASTLAKNRFLQAPLKTAPAPFRLFKPALALMMKQFPVEGWDFQTVENNNEKIAFNTTRCFYLKTLTACGAPELTPSFCKTDDYIAELFPPSIRFVRLHTLGRGDPVCDFQYCRVDNA